MGTFAHKVAQTWFVLRETWHSTQFQIYYCVEVVWIANNMYMLQITCSVVILWVLYFFGIFAQKEAQTWFDLHETRHTILFGTYFCVEVVFMDIFFLALSRIKYLKLGIFCMKLGTQQYLVDIIMFKWVELKIIVICLKLLAKLWFYGFYAFLALSRI